MSFAPAFGAIGAGDMGKRVTRGVDLLSLPTARAPAAGRSAIVELDRAEEPLRPDRPFPAH